jgi:hypothetical protein
VLVLNLLVVGFVWRACSTRACSYWGGLKIVSASNMSGCANITILYLLPILAVMYILSLVVATLSLWKGRQWAGHQWVSLVNWHYYRRWPDGPPIDESRYGPDARMARSVLAIALGLLLPPLALAVGLPLVVFSQRAGNREFGKTVVAYALGGLVVWAGMLALAWRMSL